MKEVKAPQDIVTNSRDVDVVNESVIINRQNEKWRERIRGVDFEKVIFPYLRAIGFACAVRNKVMVTNRDIEDCNITQKELSKAIKQKLLGEETEVKKI